MTLPQKGFSKDSYVSVGILVAVVLGALRIQAMIVEQRYDILDIKNKIQTTEHDRWTSQDMFHYAVLLKRENPTLTIPDPKHEE